MPPRLNRRLVSPAILRRLRLYSTDQGPAIKVTNLEAPNSGHIRILELNRPSSRNAISKALLSSLRDEVDSVHSQYTSDGHEIPEAITQAGPTRALILASSSDASFCAGADLRERRGFTPDETSEFLANLRDTFTSLSALPIPTVSAVSSYALGGGLELALCTHFRVFASTATVGLPETRLGIIPGAGGTYRLPAIIGLSRARNLILTGRRVSAQEAYFLGLADFLVGVMPEDERDGVAQDDRGGGGDGDGDGTLLSRSRHAALDEAVKLATEICKGGPVAIRAALQAVAYAREDVENAMYQRVVGTEDRDEALAAFSEKRKPVFKGR